MDSRASGNDGEGCRNDGEGAGNDSLVLWSPYSKLGLCKPLLIDCWPDSWFQVDWPTFQQPLEKKVFSSLSMAAWKLAPPSSLHCFMGPGDGAFALAQLGYGQVWLELFGVGMRLLAMVPLGWARM